MDLFDYVKTVFSQSKDYEELKDYAKKKNAFMLNRFFSIQYPVQAQMFNIMNVNAVGVADSWRKVGVRFKRTPGWIFTKTKKKAKDSSTYSPSEEALSTYLKINEIGMREYKDAMKYDSEKVISDLKTIEKQINGGGR
jgi:hypothetical protein